MRTLLSISMSFMVALAAGTMLKADTVTINDLADSVTLSTTSTRYAVFSSTPESGSANSAMAIGFSGPSGATFGSTTIPVYFVASSSSGGKFPDIQYGFVASENDGAVISDALALSTTPFPNFGAPFALFFNSDGDPSSLLCAKAPHGCNVTETGPISGTITWDLPTGATVVDTITFNSDVSEVPEPSTFPLLLTAVAGCFLALRRRRSA